eukprot:1059863-Pyramimonas_sp.AAC.2
MGIYRGSHSGAIGCAIVYDDEYDEDEDIGCALWARPRTPLGGGGQGGGRRRRRRPHGEEVEEGRDEDEEEWGDEGKDDEEDEDQEEEEEEEGGSPKQQIWPNSRPSVTPPSPPARGRGQTSPGASRSSGVRRGLGGGDGGMISRGHLSNRFGPARGARAARGSPSEGYPGVSISWPKQRRDIQGSP